MKIKRLFMLSRCTTLIAFFSATALLQGKEILKNGGFEDRTLLPWTEEVWGGYGSISARRDTNEPITGRASAQISIRGEDDPLLNEWYYLNFRQGVVVQEGHRYTISFSVKSDQPSTTLVQLVEDMEPYRFVGQRQVNATEDVQRYEINGTASFTGTAHVLFLFGRCERGTNFWIDDVSVIEQAP